MLGATVLLTFAAMLARAARRPGVALAVLLLFFAGKQLVQLSFPFFAERGPILNFSVFGALGLIWAYRALQGRASRMLGIPREYFLHLLFIAYAVLSTAWCINPNAGDRLSDTIPYLLAYTVLVPSLIASTQGLREAYQWIAWVGGAMSAVFLLGYSQASGATRLLLEADTGTGSAIGLNPLAVGSMGAFTVVAAALARFPRGTLTLVLRLLAAAAGLLVTARTSRGDLFGTILTVSLFALLPTSTTPGLTGRRLVAAMLAIVVGTAVLYYGLFQTDYWSRYNNLAEDVGTLARREMIAAMWTYFVDHPTTWFFGCGWSSSYAIIGFYPHNGPVQALTELGLLGSALWWSSIIYVSARGFRLALLAARFRSESLDAVRPALALMLCAFISNMKAGDCVDIWLALMVATLSQIIRRFRPESQKALLR